MNMKQTVEQAALKWIKDVYSYDKELWTEDAFEAGAEWQRKQSPWISVKDKRPTGTDAPFFAYNADRNEICLANYNEEKGYFDDASVGCHTGIKVTHWMPIPKLPKGGGE